MELIKQPQVCEFFDYNSYCETRLLKPHRETCYRCNKEKNPLTPIETDFYYLPCWGCSSSNEIDKKALTDCILKNINIFYSRFISDRFLQLFILDDIYYKNTLSHDFKEFKSVLGKLDIPDKNSFWFLDWKLGYPKIITNENLEGFKIVNISHLYKVEETEEKELLINNVKIQKPITVPFDQKHYYKNSIFNVIDTNRTRKLKVAIDKCYKFYNTGNNTTRSIFNLTEEGEKVFFNNLTVQDYTILKLAVLRNKSYLKIIQEVVNSLISDSRVSDFRDTVFLKNSIKLRPIDEGIVINLVWNPVENILLNSNCINISIF